jgi:hypothetical protein
MITVEITSTNYIVNATEAVNNITVTADNSLFTVTSVSQSFTVTNVSPVVAFTTDGGGFDFATKNRGEWVSNDRYFRNDVVYYEYSTYICSIAANTFIETDVPPPQNLTNWELFIFHEWPNAYLTITNWLDVGTDVEIGGQLDVGGDANIGGDLNVSNTATIGGDTTIGGDIDVDGNAIINGNLDINGTLNGVTFIEANTGTFRTTLNVGNTNTTGTFFINGLRFPQDKGTYGQVLFTGGDETSQAAWVNLGELVFWELSEDLKTEGFNIVSGGTANQLTIGRGTSSNIVTSIEFPSNIDRINIDTALLDLTGRIDIGGRADVGGSLRVNGTYSGSGTAERIRPLTGIQFPDGSFLDSASFTTGTTGTFVLPIASRSRLGVVRIGDGLEITEAGLLSTTASGYVLPAATDVVRGGIRVGNGLTISSGDVLNVSTTTEFSNISLTEDMRTNGFKIKFSNTFPNSNLTLGQDDANLNAASLTLSGTTVTVDASGNAIIDGNDGVTLRRSATTTTTFVLQSSSIEARHATLIDLKAPVLRAGSDIDNSKVQASSYYNYAGTGAAFFPANIKFSDDTIQRTAWRGYDQGLI